MIRDLTLLAARLAIGEGVASHGAQKAFGWFGGPGPEGAATLLSGLGFRPGESYASLVAYNEMVSGELIALGLGGPIGPAMLVANMIVAAATVHAKNGFFAQGGGVEVPVLYASAALAFAGGDYGRLSLDHALGIHETLRRPLLTSLALAGAVAGAMLVLGSRQLTGEGPASPTYRGNGPVETEESPAPA